nr:7957_t:CDS:2 [Entrophospora candida]
MKEERSISYFTDPEGNGPLFEMIIQKREYVVLYGAQASGKSNDFRELLSLKGYICIYVSLELVNATDTVKEFWVSFGICLTHDISENNDLKSISVFESVRDLHIESAIDFIDIFNKSNWKKIILFSSLMSLINCMI